MIPGWLRGIFNICKKQPESQDKTSEPKNPAATQKPPPPPSGSNYQNKKPTVPRNDGVVTGVGLQPVVIPYYVGSHGGGSGCGGGGGDGGGCGGGCGGCGGD